MARSFKKEIGEMIERLYPDYDPVAAMAGIAQDPDVDISVRVRCHETVAKYIHPQLKAIVVDHTSTDGTMTPVNRIELVAKDGFES